LSTPQSTAHCISPSPGGPCNGQMLQEAAAASSFECFTRCDGLEQLLDGRA